MSLLGVDCVDVTAIQGLQFDWAAGYAGGFWPTYSPICQAYPALAAKGWVRSYAVNAGEKADGADFEKGDLVVEQADPWMDDAIARGVLRPFAYGSLDTWQNGGLGDALDHFGDSIARIVADWTYIEGPVYPGFDAQQFSDRWQGRNVDGNSALASFLPAAPGPPHVNGPDYAMFTGTYNTARWGKLREQLVVEEYDGARQHPEKYVSYLPKLEAELQWLADRVAYQAIFADPLKNGKPSWGKYSRGPRYQAMIHRSLGMRFV